MEDWIIAINAHIICTFKQTRGITTDYFDRGEIYTSFWRVPPSASGIHRLPVGIRSLPFLDSPRTLEAVHPGEVIEAVQVLENDGNTFLRLADDRGWVYERHWKVKYDLLQRLDGIFTEDEQEIAVDHTDESYQKLVFTGPSVNCSIANYCLNESRVRITAKFSVSDDNQMMLTFGKLKRQRGWIVLGE
jgi:hypothetical protein